MTKKSILIVDDDVNLISGLRRSLRSRSEEWNVTYATSASEALDIMSTRRFNLIITDYKMPGLNGIELLTLVRDKYPETHRILLTGQSEDEVFEQSNEIVDLYLSKPVPTEILVKSMDEIINK